MKLLSLLAMSFQDAAKRSLKYGYFAPIQAGWLAGTRHGGYFKHLRALYRLAFKTVN